MEKVCGILKNVCCWSATHPNLTIFSCHNQGILLILLLLLLSLLFTIINYKNILLITSSVPAITSTAASITSVAISTTESNIKLLITFYLLLFTFLSYIIIQRSWRVVSQLISLGDQLYQIDWLFWSKIFVIKSQKDPIKL